MKSKVLMEDVSVNVEDVLEKIKKTEHKKGIEDKKDIKKDNVDVGLESHVRKLNRKEKELKESQSKEKTAHKKYLESKLELDTEKKEGQNKDNKIKYLSKGNEDKDKKIQDLTKKLEMYNEKEKQQKGIKIEDLEKDIEELKKDREESSNNLGEVIESKNNHINKLKKQIKGEKKTKTKSHKKNTEQQKRKNKLDKKEENLEQDKRELGEERHRFEEELKVLSRRNKHLRENEHVMLEVLEERLTLDSMKRYGVLNKLMKKYEQLKKDKLKIENYGGEELGYLIKEGKTHYFVSLDGENAGKIVKKKGNYYREGTVCRASVYKDGKVYVKKFLPTSQVMGENYTEEKQERVRKIQKGKSRVSVDNKFFEGVYKYKTVIVTSQNKSSYNEYFQRYGVIDVVDGYADGMRKVKSQIAKADIVIVRPDAVAHEITDYIKTGYKEKTAFIDNGGRKEMADVIYNKALEMKKNGQLEK